MSTSDKIVDAVIWLFNLLTFLVAILSFCIWVKLSYVDRELTKGVGNSIFVLLLLIIDGCIVWKTGRWLFAKPEKIYVPGLLASWVFLIMFYFLFIGLAMGSRGLGSSQ